MRFLHFAVLACGACGGTTTVTERAPTETGPATFASDVSFLRAHLPDLVVLERGSARIAVAPAYQGRVMTSGTREDGPSFGWIHRAHIESGERTPHMNAYGGEDRFWLGPEGGPYALYFQPGAPFDFEHWQVPEAIDTAAWAITEQSSESVSFGHEVRLTNHAGTELAIRIERTVRFVDLAQVDPPISIPDGLESVAYETVNRITNIGAEPWTPEHGLVSIWILGMYPPSGRAMVVIPFVPGSSEERGAIVNDAYFGAVPTDRLVIDEQGVLFFRADGQRRAKIGISQARARGMAGSWDPVRGALTLVFHTLPDHPEHGYVNSMWADQDEPYAGDVLNSYNDGPPTPGAAPMGPFYELESSSPAAALAPNEHIEHVHRTVHLTGARTDLDSVAQAQLGASLDRIESVSALD